MLDYDEYEKKREKIIKTNDELLKMFAKSIKGLSAKTIRRHIINVDVFINDFLLYYDALSFDQGITSISDFLGDFFIRKCMWSTPASIKTTAGSIKKFYKCMVENNKISVEDYKYLCEIIKYEMPIWQEKCRKYNNPDEEYMDYDMFL